MLSGSASDTDGSIRTYRWTQLSGSKAVIVAGQNQAAVTFIAPTLVQTETLVFQLLVNDEQGASATDVVPVNVTPVNAPSQINTTIQAQADEQTRVDLLASAIDSDGSIKNVEWRQAQGTPVEIIDANTLNAYFTAPITTQVEKLLFKLLVTDSEDAIVEKNILIQINPVNKKPQVEDLINLEVIKESLVTLEANASDDDGSIIAYQWKQIGGEHC